VSRGEVGADRPFTLAIDIGGSGLKASVLDASGAMVAERVRVRTPYPLSPERLVGELAALAARLPPADRVAAGFPGMVRAGRVLTAPHFVTVSGPGSPVDAALEEAWRGFDLAGALERRFGLPARVANDADLQGAAVVSGRGLELVVTLGTGFGTGLFYDGRLLPHLEIAHHPFREGETYNEQLGDQARRRVGDERWTERVRIALDTLRALVFFDCCYVGGGNAKHLVASLGEDVVVVDNAAGILGGIKLFEGGHLGLD
jgi:polyphosphate glucokinase